MSLIIAGERSGVGKTTITLALLSYLSRQGCSVQSFKVGPDYIDPMFHTYVTKKYCRNLDPILTSIDYVKYCFNQHCQGSKYALVEGVMGLFDGVPFQGYSSFASTAHIANILNLPVLLVLDCSKLSTSVGAIASGFRNFDPQLNIAGVILNRVGSDRHLHLLESGLEGLNLPILGVFYRQNDLTIPDRHLGLVPTGELNNFNIILDKLAELAKNCFDWEKLFPLLEINCIHAKPSFLDDPLLDSQDNKEVKNIEQGNILEITSNSKSVRIAVACDRAFNFYYQDNFDILRKYGAELVFWSPLEDKNIPENVQGFYFGGGFPEVFAEELADNITVVRSLHHAIKLGIPTYAECGGLMYLCEAIGDFQGVDWPMVGIFSKIAVMEKRLTLGYRHSEIIINTPFLKIGETVYGHEFHRSKLINCNDGQSSKNISEIRPIYGEKELSFEGMIKYKVHASYLHLHFGGCQILAKNFCRVGKYF